MSPNSKKLGWLLCWGVVFADIGTSLYYVPGILYGEVGNLAGLFVAMSSAVFVLLVMKYVDITARYPEGGGVVTVATRAFGPWMGAFGGMLITVDYYLTASISSISGFAYLNSVVDLGGYVLVAAIIAIIGLGILNVIGIQESAKVTAVVAILALIIDLIVVTFVSTQIGPEGWSTVFASLSKVSDLKPVAILTGFAGSFLAFSGLESISQLSPAMQMPRKKIASIAMGLVVVSILLTSPLLTLFSTNLLNAKLPGTDEEILTSISHIKERESKIHEFEKMETLTHEQEAEVEVLKEEVILAKEYSERFMSELGAQYGGVAVKIAVVATASILLIFAANTAIIGAYHVFISLARQRFLPQFLLKNNTRFDTPHWAILLAVLPPVLIIMATKGDVTLLGQLYAFGLLGAFSLSSIGLDVVHWKEKKKLSPMLILGIITTILVVVAWSTNLVSKPLATVFGGAITLAGMGVAYMVRKNSKEEELIQVEIKKETEIEPGTIFVPFYDEYDASLFEFVGGYAKGVGKKVTLMYIREFADILQTVSENIEIDQEAAKYLKDGSAIVRKYGVEVNDLYEATAETADVINAFRKDKKPALTILSPHKTSMLVDFIKGNIIEDVVTTSDGNVLIYTGKQ